MKFSAFMCFLVKSMFLRCLTYVYLINPLGPPHYFSFSFLPFFPYFPPFFSKTSPRHPLYFLFFSTIFDVLMRRSKNSLPTPLFLQFWIIPPSLMLFSLSILVWTWGKGRKGYYFRALIGRGEDFHFSPLKTEIICWFLIPCCLYMFMEVFWSPHVLL